MDQKLKDLRKHMVKTRLHEMDFPEHRKQKVLEQIKNPPAAKQSFAWASFWKHGLSATVCLGLLFGGIAIAMNHPDSSSEAINHQNLKSNVGPSSSSVKGTSSHVSADGPKTQHYPPVKDPGPLTKEQVANRMLNTPDYFKTAQGSYIDIFNHQKAVVDYEVLLKQGNQYRSYCKTTVPGKGVISIEITNGTHLIQIFPKDQMFQESRTVPYHKGKPVTIDSVFRNTGDGALTFDPRSRPASGASNSLFPYEKAGSFLRDFNRWHIVNEDATVAGQKAVVVKGTSDRQSPKAFKFVINRATGILMNLKYYDSQGHVIESMQTTKLQLNKPVDMSKFTIHVPKGYTNQNKKMMQQMKRDPRVNKIKNVVTVKNDPTKVANVLQETQKKMPYLYSFQGRNFDVFLASLKKYNQYYFSKWIVDIQSEKNANGGTSKVLFVREYNKNGFVPHKGGDFQDGTAFKKHAVKPFTLNGIHWKGYTGKVDSNQPRTHLTGTKGNDVYEIVGQELPFAKVKKYLKSFKKD